MEKIEKPEGWDQIPETQRRYVMALGGQMWNRAINKLELRKHALELAVAAVGPQSPGASSGETSNKIELVANRLLAWLEKEKPKEST